MRYSDSCRVHRFWPKISTSNEPTFRHWSGVPFQNFNHPCQLDNIPVGNWLTHVNPTTYFEVNTCEKWRTRVFLPFDPECQPRMRLNTQFNAMCNVPNYSSCGRSSPNFRNIGRNPPPKNVAALGLSRFDRHFPPGLVATGPRRQFARLVVWRRPRPP